MDYLVNAATSFNLKPSNVIDEILQNVATILATTRYSVPYARGLGLNPTYLDKPIPVAEALAAADITESIHKGEPRCRVDSITFGRDDKEGILVPTVKVIIND